MFSNAQNLKFTFTTDEWSADLNMHKLLLQIEIVVMQWANLLGLHA